MWSLESKPQPSHWGCAFRTKAVITSPSPSVTKAKEGTEAYNSCFLRSTHHQKLALLSGRAALLFQAVILREPFSMLTGSHSSHCAQQIFWTSVWIPAALGISLIVDSEMRKPGWGRSEKLVMCQACREPGRVGTIMMHSTESLTVKRECGPRTSGGLCGVGL